MNYYFITAGTPRPTPADIVSVSIPDNMVVIAYTAGRTELKYNCIPRFRGFRKHVIITNKCW